MSELQDQDSAKSNIPDKRILKFLCTLTFMGSGIELIAFSLLTIFPQMFTQNPEIKTQADLFDFLRILINAGSYFLWIMTLLFASSLLGSIFMWNFRKIGFHIYTSSQILLLIVPMTFIKGFPIAALSIFITILFIFTYSRFLKLMR
jgi:hypothetical protein